MRVFATAHDLHPRMGPPGGVLASRRREPALTLDRSPVRRCGPRTKSPGGPRYGAHRASQGDTRSADVHNQAFLVAVRRLHLLLRVVNYGHPVRQSKEVAMDGNMAGMGAVMLIWGLVGLALVAFAVLGIVWLVRRGENNGPRMLRQESPEEVLRRRYAAGDLDEDDYLRRRSGLNE